MVTRYDQALEEAHVCRLTGHIEGRRHVHDIIQHFASASVDPRPSAFLYARQQSIAPIWMALENTQISLDVLVDSTTLRRSPHIWNNRCIAVKNSIQSNPLSRQITWGRLSTLSSRIRCSLSTTTRNATRVVNIDARAVDAQIMNMMIIWSFAARSTDAPPRIAPVIIPGIDIMPRTLLGRTLSTTCT